ncbi:uncharacterized protein RHIMIDRAFT_290291 [Rhizopus microsporus ATCC 52813]|uniref:Uncharacterized protein n=1 Tax=Rhizopus microsporus ATCC 52813 TaxID=1340429 RepID=A0A2G4T0T1_RHIZD|nr:uncharacterized protein RHIMIDRAFT_290291 [Rhizopus microsporus ATCC 52813]PHZ14614.1 hypothetical protein RHIMIDRAFT_290291 [Rhizopus microsporus ATCC 52813]
MPLHNHTYYMRSCAEKLVSICLINIYLMPIVSLLSYLSARYAYWILLIIYKLLFQAYKQRSTCG